MLCGREVSRLSDTADDAVEESCLISDIDNAWISRVEGCVLIVERWLLGRLRHRTFYSLAELSAAVADLMTRLNEERVIRRAAAPGASFWRNSTDRS